MTNYVYNQVMKTLVANKPKTFIYDTPFINEKLIETLHTVKQEEQEEGYGAGLGSGWSILIEPSDVDCKRHEVMPSLPSCMSLIEIGKSLSQYNVTLTTLKDALECNAWLLDVIGKKETHSLMGYNIVTDIQI